MPERSATSDSTNHPDAETLATFMDGRLPAVERRIVETHVAKCAGCHELVAEVLTHAPSRPRRRIGAGLVAAGTLAAIAVLTAIAMLARGC
jgi:hypothetical protein